MEEALADAQLPTKRPPKKSHHTTVPTFQGLALESRASPWKTVYLQDKQ